jgi:hypothetical protein
MPAIPDTLLAAREGDVLLITAKGGHWGKGSTIKDAKAALKQAGGSLNPKGWRVRSIEPNAYADSDGVVYFAGGTSPLVIAEYGMAKG